MDIIEEKDSGKIKNIRSRKTLAAKPNLNRNDIENRSINNVLPKSIKLSDYRCFSIPNINSVYIQLLNDNLQYLIEYIYSHSTIQPYDVAATRVALSMQMILSSDQLVPYQLSSLIAKDIEELRKNDEYTNLWSNPTLKRKALSKDLEMLKKHTEIDENISLNSENPREDDPKQNLRDFDIHSGLSTLNVSSQYPVNNEINNGEPGNCLLM